MSLRTPLSSLSAVALLTIAGIATNEDTTRKLVVVGAVSGAVGASAALQRVKSLEGEDKRQRQVAEKT